MPAFVLDARVLSSRAVASRDYCVCFFSSFGLALVSPSVVRCAFAAERRQRASKTTGSQRHAHGSSLIGGLRVDSGLGGEEPNDGAA